MAGVIEFAGVQLYPQLVAIPASPGDLSIQNILGSLKQVNDQGVATSIGGGGSGITALTGDVTASGTGSVAATIAAGAVTLAKMANLAANTVIGNNTGVSAVPVALTVAQLQAMGLGFAADTIVQMNNGSGTPASAWESIITLPTATAGAEVSKWVVKLLNAGAQVAALTVNPLGIVVPDGSANVPGISWGTAGGIGYLPAQSATFINGTNGAFEHMFSTGRAWINSNSGYLTIGVSQDVLIQRTAAGLTLYTQAGTGDTIIGRSPAVAGTAGFLCVPSVGGVAGIPANAATGTMFYVDTTNNLAKFYYGGAWHSCALT